MFADLLNWYGQDYATTVAFLDEINTDVSKVLDYMDSTLTEAEFQALFWYQDTLDTEFDDIFTQLESITT
jgi:hypothetical protein